MYKTNGIAFSAYILFITLKGIIIYIILLLYFIIYQIENNALFDYAENSSLAQGKGGVLWLFVKKSYFLVGGICKHRCSPGSPPSPLGMAADKSIIALVKEPFYDHKSAILNAGVGASGRQRTLYPTTHVRLSSSPRFHHPRWRKGLFLKF